MQIDSSEYYRVIKENERLENHLKRMEAIFEAVRSGRISLTHDSNDFKALDHVYDERVILGMLETHIYDALKLKHPGGNPIGWDVSHNNT